MNEQDAIIAAFTEMASHYEQTVDREIRQFWGIGYRDFISRFIARMNLNGQERVLDIGTGMAVVPVTLLSHTQWHGDVIGLDITPDMLAGARDSLGDSGICRRVHLVCGSGMVLPLRSGSFDAVTCALATHHMNVPALLREIRRVLRPGGQLLLADVGLADFWSTRRGRLWIGLLATFYGWKEGKMRAQAELDAMKNVLSPETWRSMLLKVGFADLRIEVLPAKRRWYPPGLLIQAHSNLTAE
jgi:ubiquinone/menaquinone biosynthesis C-methylase UbiE